MELRARAARENGVREGARNMIGVVRYPRSEEVSSLGGLLGGPDGTPCACAVASGDGQFCRGGGGVIRE